MIEIATAATAVIAATAAIALAMLVRANARDAIALAVIAKELAVVAAAAETSAAEARRSAAAALRAANELASLIKSADRGRWSAEGVFLAGMVKRAFLQRSRIGGILMNQTAMGRGPVCNT